MKNLSAMAAVKVVALMAAFFLGFAWALPWDRLAEHALLEASLQGDKTGVQVSYGSATKISTLPPRVEIRDLAIGSLLLCHRRCVLGTRTGRRPHTACIRRHPSAGVGERVSRLWRSLPGLDCFFRRRRTLFAARQRGDESPALRRK